MDSRLKPVRARDKRRSFFYDQLPPPPPGEASATSPTTAVDSGASAYGAPSCSPSAAAAAAAVAEAAAQASELSSMYQRGSADRPRTLPHLDPSGASGLLHPPTPSTPSGGSPTLRPRDSVSFAPPGSSIANSSAAALAARAAVDASHQQGDTPVYPRPGRAYALRRGVSFGKLPLDGVHGERAGGVPETGGRRMKATALAATAAVGIRGGTKGQREDGPNVSRFPSLPTVNEEGYHESLGEGGRGKNVSSSSLSDKDGKVPGGSDDFDKTNDEAVEHQGQLGTDFMRNVPFVLGIPVYSVGTGVTLGSFLGLLLVGVMSFFLFTSWWNANILSEDVVLPRTGLDATLHLRNCAVQFLPLSEADDTGSEWGKTSFMRVSAWLGFQEHPRRRNHQAGSSVESPVRWKSPQELSVLLRVSNYAPWFRCSVRFYLATDFVFNSLDVLFFPADNYVNLDAEVPLTVKERFSIDAFHAFLYFQSIEAPNMSFSLVDGHLRFALDAPQYSKYPVTVNSRTASVSIESRHPLAISLDADAAARSLLRASGSISVPSAPDVLHAGLNGGGGSNGNNSDQQPPPVVPPVTAMLYPSDASAIFASMSALPITFDCEQCALFAVARTPTESLEETPMETWVGQVHAAQPHLIPYAEEKVSSALRWLADDPSAPWVINVEPIGVPDAAGVWRILSSNAYLNTVYWFVVLSGGMLRPRTLHLPLQIMGLFCRSVIDVDEDDIVADVITSAEDYLGGTVSHYFTHKSQSAGSAAGDNAKRTSGLIPSAISGLAGADLVGTGHQTEGRRLAATEEGQVGIVNNDERDGYDYGEARRQEMDSVPGTMLMDHSSTQSIWHNAMEVSNKTADSLLRSDNGSDSDATSWELSSGRDGAGWGPRGTEPRHSGSREKYRYQLLKSRQKLYEEYYAVKKRTEQKLRDVFTAAADPFTPPPHSASYLQDPSSLFASSYNEDLHELPEPDRTGSASAEKRLLMDSDYPMNGVIKEKGHADSSGRGAAGHQRGSVPTHERRGGSAIRTKRNPVGQYQPLYRYSSLPTAASSSLLGLGNDERAFLQDNAPAPVRMLVAKDSVYPGTSVGTTKPLSMCINEVIEDTFLVLWNAFNDTRTSSTLYVWSREFESSEYLYSVLSDALVKSRVGVSDTWYFLVAIVINILAAIVLAVMVVYALYIHFLPHLTKQDREATVLRDASHRLDHELSGGQSRTEQVESSWNVMVSRVQYPCHGLLLRWSAPEGTAGGFVRLGVHIRPADIAWAEAANDTETLLTLSQKEVYVYLNASSVQTVHQLGLNQRELFLPMQHPGMTDLETTQSYKLDPNTKYRVRLVRFTVHGRALDQSRWSPEIILGGALTFTDYPILIMRRLLPSNLSSLDIFLRKFTYVATHFAIPVTLTNLKLQLFDMPPEARARRLGRMTSGAFSRLRRSPLLAGGDDEAAVKRWGSDVENVLESVHCDYVASAHFGFKAQFAKETFARTGRRVYSEVRFTGYPTIIEPNEAETGDQQPYLELSAGSGSFRLRKDRIAHNTIGFEVGAGLTGQVLAYGTIRFDDLYQIVKDLVQKSHKEDGDEEDPPTTEDGAPSAVPGSGNRFRVGLEYVDGGGPWGRLECSLDIENIRTYIRHFGREEDSAFQRKRPRQRSNMPTGRGTSKPDDLAVTDHLPVVERGARQPTEGGALPGRRGRLSRVEGTSQDILAQLGLLNGPSEDAEIPSSRSSGEHRQPGMSIELSSQAGGTGRRARRATRLEVSGDQEMLKVPLLSASESTAMSSSGHQPLLSTRRTTKMPPVGSVSRADHSPPYFVRDSPGRPVLQGADLFVQWVWPDTASHPEHVYLALFLHEGDRFIGALHWGRPIPNTGSYAWSVDTAFRRGEQCQLVYIAMFTEPLEPPLDVCSAVCESNAFYIVRPTPLAELELVYASFCRTHGLEMEHMSEAALHKYGFDVREHMLKICQDLRPPLGTEPQTAAAVHCPGQCLISTQSKMVMLERADGEAHNSSATTEEKQVVVYKSITRKVKLIENLGVIRDVDWWTKSPDILLLNNDLFYASALMQKIRSFLSKVGIFHLLAGVTWRDAARRLLTGQESRSAWTLARFTEFKLLPSLINVSVIFSQSIVFFAFPLFIVLFTAFQSFYLTEAHRCLRKQKNEHYFSDVFFEADIRSLSRLSFGKRLVVGFCWLYITVMTIAIFFNVFLRQRFPRALKLLDLTGRVLVTLSIFTTAWALSAFLFWFLLGALVNSDSFLPYAAMLGSVVFVVGYLWMNFLSSRDGVRKFIEDNIQLLLSLALDHWFATMNISYTGKEQVTADEVLVAYRDRIRDELRDGRLRLQREYQLGHFAQAGSYDDDTSSTRAVADLAKFKQRKEKLAIYVFEKYTAPPNQDFSFNDRGMARGLENIANLPEGARFATVAEVERHSEKIDDMMSGWETALLKDGVKYGPRFGYKVENRPQPGQSYTYAIVALPRYPPPDELDDLLKTQMVFDYFNKEGKEYLTKTEFLALLNKVRDSQADEHNWPELCAYFNDIANTNIDPSRGITVPDLVKIYSLQSGELDRDYEKLYPTIRQDELDEDIEDLERMTDEDEISGQSEEEVSDYDETTSEEEDDDDDAGDAEGDDSETAKATSQEEERIEVELKTNPNARKLQYIYNYSTQENRGPAIDELISSVSFLASKILDTHVLLLSPVFGREAILGVPAGSAQRLGRVGTTITPAGVLPDEDRSSGFKKDERFVTMMKVIQLEFIQELSRQFRLVHASMFDNHNVRAGVQDFYDNVIPQQVSTKASRLLNESLELTKADIYPTNADQLLTSPPPKTASQLMRAIQKYRIEKDQDIKQVLTYIWRTQGGALQIQLQVHLVCKTLLDLELLTDDHFVTNSVEVPTDSAGSMMTEFKALCPVEPACLKLITEAIDKQLGGRLRRMTSTTHLVQVLRHIVDRNLWFDCFLFLVQLMGNDIYVDELPGGAVGVDELGALLFEDADDPHVNSFDEGNFSPSQKRYRRNLLRIKAVFDQLSNYAGFLPLDLVDEAIQLLTDNRLNFSGVVACLQHLKIGSVYIEDSGDLQNTFDHLGIRKESPVCDIEASSETVNEVIDWTSFRKDPGWTPELFRAFDRLTSSCPGYMGKSQMFEFVKEIHKLFQPQVSEMRRGRDRLRGRKQEHKPGSIMQLGGVSREQALRQVDADDGDASGMILPADVTVDTADESMRMVSFEMFHKVATKLGLSVSHRHSRIMWIILSLDSYEDIQQFLPERDVKLGLVRIYFQPLVGGRPATNRDSVSSIMGYKGYVTFVLFRRILRQLGVVIPDKSARIVWDDLPKEPLDITDFVPPVLLSETCPTKYLRIEMDKLGMDPMKGRVASMEMVKKKLPRMLMTGLWPEAIRVLLKLSLQLDVAESHISSVLAGMDRRANRYGLIRPEDIGGILSNLSVNGMSFSMLRDVIQKMRVLMPEQDIKRMFDLMDINQDLTLSLGELLSGFEVLFGRLMPVLVLKQVGLSNERMLTILCCTTLGLLAFFGFLGLAFSSFEGLKSGISTAVQSLLAVLGAVGLQSSASQEMEQVEAKMKERIEMIMGDQLSKAKEQVEELQEYIKPERPSKEGKPTKLRYLVPRKFRPDLEDPRPCVTFSPGSYVRLDPTVSGRVDRDKLRWSISPRLPKKTGLTFNTRTGIIEGTIPSQEEHLGSFQLGEKKIFRSSPSMRSDGCTEGGPDERITSHQHDAVMRVPSHHPVSSFGAKPFRVARRTYTVVVRNSAGYARARVTFQIQHRGFLSRQQHKKEGKETTADSRRDFRKRQSVRVVDPDP